MIVLGQDGLTYSAITTIDYTEDNLVIAYRGTDNKIYTRFKIGDIWTDWINYKNSSTNTFINVKVVNGFSYLTHKGFDSKMYLSFIYGTD